MGQIFSNNKFRPWNLLQYILLRNPKIGFIPRGMTFTLYISPWYEVKSSLRSSCHITITIHFIYQPQGSVIICWCDTKGRCRLGLSSRAFLLSQIYCPDQVCSNQMKVWPNVTTKDSSEVTVYRESLYQRCYCYVNREIYSSYSFIK